MKKKIAYQRVEKFTVMRPPMTLQDAVKESARCLLCEDAPCSKACPAGTDPGKFIRQIRFENLKGAARTIRNNNIMGAVCAFTCPVEKLCEKECQAKALDEPINIAGLQGFACEYGMKNGLEPFEKGPADKGNVAVVGAGPAGMACAAELTKKGYSVTIFEKEGKAGGVAAWAIPQFRLPNEAVEHAVKGLKELGVKIEFNKPAVNPLNDGFRACFISTGLCASGELELLKGLENTVTARDFLRTVKYGEKKPDMAGKVVAVIGGGSVAMDSAVTAKALGAKKVYAISLEALNELPADAEEIDLARGMHVIFKAGSQITGVVSDKNKALALKGVEIEWKKPGDFSPSNAKAVEGTEFNIKTDFVIQAIGSLAADDVKNTAKDLKRGARGTIVVQEDFSTSVPGVFAGGDIASGGATIAKAVGDGKKAAEGMVRWMRDAHIVHRPSSPDLSVTFCGKKCPNPFFLSSSPVSNTAEMCERAFEYGWGGIVYKTFGLESKFKIIMPSPRLSVLHYEDKRFVGLQNAEQISDRPVKDNMADIAHIKKRFPGRILVSSIMGFVDEDWAVLAKMSEDAGADMLELNFSCPQMARKDAGHRVGQSYEAVSHFTSVVKKASRLPVIAKMTPNITDMVPVALAAKEGGADSVSAINTIRGITDVDLEQFTPRPAIHGQSAITGCSGPASKPVALRFVSELYNSKELGLPVSGIGGITTWKDALQFILLGATTIQVTTAIMRYGYRIAEDMIEGLGDWMNDRGIKTVAELVGKAAVKLVDPSELNNRFQVVSKIDRDKCIGCGQCYISCRDASHQAIKFDYNERKAEVDEEKCVGCLLCKHLCPVWDCISYKEVDTMSTKHAAVF